MHRTFIVLDIFEFLIPSFATILDRLHGNMLTSARMYGPMMRIVQNGANVEDQVC